jgi:hypothetical protein
VHVFFGTLQPRKLPAVSDKLLGSEGQCGFLRLGGEREAGCAACFGTQPGPAAE